MAIAGDSGLAAARSLGMLNNNPFIHHGMRGVGSLCSFVQFETFQGAALNYEGWQSVTPPPLMGELLDS